MYGFVRMEEHEDAIKAVSALNGKLYMGRVMR
jgi:RNA recognition motif-containing protein